MIANQMIPIPSEKAVVGVAKLSGSPASSISIADLKGKENFVIFPASGTFQSSSGKAPLADACCINGTVWGHYPGVSALQSADVTFDKSNGAVTMSGNAMFGIGLYYYVAW